MSTNLATVLHNSGKSHAEAACLLYRASFDQAQREDDPDPVRYAFNGPYSLSVQYLLGLGLKLMLKSAIVAWHTEADADYLKKEVGHDLVAALDHAEGRGFTSQAPHLREFVEVLREPYRQHWFRYERPDQFSLPHDFEQIVGTLTVLEGEISEKLSSAGTEPARPT